MQIHIVGKTGCPFCDKAKQYLTSNGIEYIYKAMDDANERQAFYASIGNGVRTVPQVYVDGIRLGGYQDLIVSDVVARHQAGNFDADF